MTEWSEFLIKLTVYCIRTGDQELWTILREAKDINRTGWIDCKDRMPPVNEHVLLYWRNHEIFLGYKEQDDPEYNEKWSRLIKFWMPLPKPPEPKKEAE